MSASRRGGGMAFASALALAAALLGGCAGAPAGGGRDLQTASDETDATRRARVRLELAAAYYTQGQYTTALDEVKQALAASPDLADAYNLRGLVYTALGEPSLADDSFRRALQIAPRNADALHNYGWFQCQQRRWAEAKSYFAQALEQPRYRGAARTQLAQGVCLMQEGRLEQAEAALQHAFELEPANLAAALNLADVLYRRGDYERARFYIRRVNNTPDVSNAQTLWLAARIEQRAGNPQGAAEIGRQLRNRFPQSREAAAFERNQFDD